MKFSRQMPLADSALLLRPTRRRGAEAFCEVVRRIRAWPRSSRSWNLRGAQHGALLFGSWSSLPGLRGSSKSNRRCAGGAFNALSAGFSPQSPWRLVKHEAAAGSVVSIRFAMLCISHRIEARKRGSWASDLVRPAGLMHTSVTYVVEGLTYKQILDEDLVRTLD